MYNRVINGNFGPRLVLNDSGYFELGVDGYIGYLSGLHIFTDSFFERERLRLSICQAQLKELKQTDIDVHQATPKACSFLDFNYWLNSQEKPDGYELNGYSHSSSAQKMQMKFYSASGGERFYWNNIVSLRIVCMKMKAQWLVDEIVKVDE